VSTETVLLLLSVSGTASWLTEYSWLGLPAGAQLSGSACRTSTSMADAGREKTSSMAVSDRAHLCATRRLNCPRELLATPWMSLPRLATWRMSHVLRGGTAVAAGGGCAMGTPRRTFSTASWQSFQFSDQSRPTEPYTGLSMRPHASYSRDLNIAATSTWKSHEHSAKVGDGSSRYMGARISYRVGRFRGQR
jgi:hypothetical protein